MPNGNQFEVLTMGRAGVDVYPLQIGRSLQDALHRFGVDDRFVTPVDGLSTPVTFCEIFPPDDFPTAVGLP